MIKILITHLVVMVTVTAQVMVTVTVTGVGSLEEQKEVFLITKIKTMKEDTFNYLVDRYGSDEYYEYISQMLKLC